MEDDDKYRFVTWNNREGDYPLRELIIQYAVNTSMFGSSNMQKRRKSCITPKPMQVLQEHASLTILLFYHTPHDTWRHKHVRENSGNNVSVI